MAFVFQPTGIVYSHKLVVFPFSAHAAFCTLQSRPHEVWARSFGSSMKDDSVYTPSDCFETFPFPDSWETHPALEAAGRAYYEFRAALMARNNEGLTKTYNRFHDQDERDPQIAELRTLHAEMDSAVLAAYGWTDIPTACEFRLDHGDADAGGDASDDQPPPPAGRRRGSRRKPYRYRWPPAVRDEVLARLLALNAERAAEEARAARAVTLTDEKPRRPDRPRRPVSLDADLAYTSKSRPLWGTSDEQ